MTNVRRVQLTLILAVAVAGARLWADDNNVNFTDNEPNGHYWALGSHEEKIVFVVGYDAGSMAVMLDNQEALKGKLQTDSTVSPNLKTTYNDIVDGVDEFYQHPENRTLAIRVAIRMFFLKVGGASAECLQASAEYWRAPFKSTAETQAMAKVKQVCYAAPAKEPEKAVFR